MSCMRSQGGFPSRHPSGIFPSNAPHRAFSGRLLLLTVAVAASAMGGCSSTQNAVSSVFAPLSSGSSSSRAPMFPESKWGVSTSRRVAGENERIEKGGGVYKVGEPYQVGGRWYNPREQPEYDRIGVASWYGSDFHGRHTANGEVFDMYALTAAHPTLPLPSYAYVTNLSNNRTVLVRINDRGPYVGDRMIDLSKASANALGLMSGGTGRVRVRYAGPAPLDGNDVRERQFLAAGPSNGAYDIASVERDRSNREWAPARQGPPVRQAWQPPEDRMRPTFAEAPPMRQIPPARTYTQAYAAAEPATDGGWSPSSYRASLVAR
jgi:rare lipoprotein A